ncbi:hypothetical protein HYH03_014409 [Edaphochlamys debaryana]|uniref:Tryptophan synthase beta chain-like PALP domain-containing protein n=1 Tax=Edaphochlamys debaryana TaxID=47281 RepID=A0A836BS60_9CHLO|nr:hypothetical protein HYH03_014409 [Edaphochlamys debaryana]|eukprot:KAG2486910.1 hypothetical protein HYH03_014409 [Edaphochlamys debaryana]
MGGNQSRGRSAAAATAAAASAEAPPSTNFLSWEPYTPPEWAKDLTLVPTHRFRLGMLPTPIHEWRLPGLPEGCRVLIKRDDLSGCQMSGNKVRKLEFLMDGAVAGGHDCVLTIGGVQSNHARATAVAAKYLGLDCHLILRTSRQLVDSDPGLIGNLLVERMAGATVHMVTKEEYAQYGSEALLERLRAELEAQGRKPYVIPVGGSNALGTWGYLQAVDEIVRQAADLEPKYGKITDVAMACGSGGTTAGLALGCHLSPLRARVHAYGVCDTPDYFYGYVDHLLAGLGWRRPDGSRGLMRAVQARGAGYAMSTEEELETARAVSDATGVVLDPVYSGKAVHGLLKEMRADPGAWRGRTVLFVHTGGLLGMYDKVDQLLPLLQSKGPAVQRLALGPDVPPPPPPPAAKEEQGEPKPLAA